MDMREALSLDDRMRGSDEARRRQQATHSGVKQEVQGAQFLRDLPQNTVDAPGNILKWARDNPVDAVFTAASMTPVVGDAIGLGYDAYGMSPWGDVPFNKTNVALAAAGVIPFVPGGMGGITRAVKAGKIDEVSKDMGLSPTIVSNLAKSGHVALPINPVSPKTGRELGFDTPYSGSRKIKTERLDELTEGFEKTTPDYGDVGNTDLANLQGKTLYPIAADRTSRDEITRVLGRDVGNYQNPGGFTYMRPSGTGGGGGFASGHGVMSRYKNMTDALGGEGVGVGTVMSGRGSDFARSGTDIVQKMGVFENMSKSTKKMLAQEMNLKIDANNKSAIEAAQKAAKKDGVPYIPPPVSPHVNETFGSEFISLLDSNPEIRKAYMEATDLHRVAKNPEIIDAITIRHAITDDRFRHLTRGEGDPLSGFDFINLRGDLIPSAKAPSPNPSYSHHMDGDYIPPLAVPTPRSILFPEFTDKMVKENRPTSEWNYMFDRMKPQQPVDQRVIDLQGEYQRKMLK